MLRRVNSFGGFAMPAQGQGFWVWRAGAVFSGLMLWAAFPPVEQPQFAWFALAPLLLAARNARDRREAFRSGLLAGVVFWLLNLLWLWRLIANGGPWPLVALGHGALSIYCALYMGLFAFGTYVLTRSPGSRGALGRLACTIVGVPLLWVGSEWLRGTLFSGFAWNFVGVTQYRSLPLIQLARWGGVYLVSALVLVANGALAGVLERMGSSRTRRQDRWRPELAVALLLVLIAWWSGMRALQRCRAESSGRPQVRVAAVQLNAPSIFERDGAGIEAVHEDLRTQTEAVVAVRPDLVVWPETAVPGALPWDLESYAFISGLALTLQTPILAGVTEVERVADAGANAEERIYNASWLFGGEGRVLARYRKQHLVPFGEFVPLASLFPALKRLSPIGYNCTPGEKTVIMRLPVGAAPEKEFRFSPLICFESTVAKLSRRAVHSGAQLLVNQTNDAWFEGSAEPRQHLAQAVFRAVETGTPMIRSANTGLTGLIDRCGMLSLLEIDGRREGFVGSRVFSIGLPETPPRTLYLRYGDLILGIPAALWLLGVLGYDLRLRRFRG